MFNIHSEVWQDAWVAATATVRARKKQVDFNIQQRVQRLLDDHGPSSNTPLTLRVYGTMIKGFCVINNERARMLYTDCERLILLFARQPFSDDARGLKLPAAKKQRVDALTLDLDLAKVRESETFDWTQAPLEEGALLQLTAPSGSQNQDDLFAQPPEAVEPAPASLLQQVALLDEAFPAVELPLVAAPEQAAAAAAAPASPGVAAGDDGAVEDAPPPPVPEGPALSLEQLAAPAHQLVLAPRRSLHGKKSLGPGHVLGFDQEVQLPAELCQSWQHDVEVLNMRKVPFRQLADAVQSDTPEHLGLLRPLVDPPEEPRPAGDPATAQSPVPPEIAALCAHLQLTEGPAECTAIAPGAEIAADAPAAGPAASTGVAPGAEMAVGRDDGAMFRPYTPGQPLAEARGAADELTELLSGQSSDTKSAGPQDSGRAVRYDSQTAKAGEVFRRFIERGNQAGIDVTLDDLLPSDAVERDTAARAFLAVLTLATAGELCVAQEGPYGPITVAAAGC